LQLFPFLLGVPLFLDRVFVVDAVVGRLDEIHICLAFTEQSQSPRIDVVSLKEHFSILRVCEPHDGFCRLQIYISWSHKVSDSLGERGFFRIRSQTSDLDQASCLEFVDWLRLRSQAKGQARDFFFDLLNCLLVLEPFRPKHYAHRCDLFQFHKVCVLRVDELVRHNVVQLSDCLLCFLLSRELNEAKSLELTVGVPR
jgi:hypothetical protein